MSFTKHRACHGYSSACRKTKEGGKDVQMREYSRWVGQDISGRKWSDPHVGMGRPTAPSLSARSSKCHTNTNLLCFGETDTAMSHLLVLPMPIQQEGGTSPGKQPRHSAGKALQLREQKEMRKWSCHPPPLAETAEQLGKILVAKYDLELHCPLLCL